MNPSRIPAVNGFSSTRALRFVFVVVAVVSVGLLFSGCGDASSSKSVPGENETPVITTTIPPLGMILEPVAQGRSTVRVLLGPGDSPHTYEPSPSDVRAVSGSLLLMHTDRHLDGWVATLPAERSVALAPMVPSSERLAMPSGDATDSTRAGHDHGEMDPHFWTSPVTVRSILPALADTLCAADPAGCTQYRTNAEAMATDLEALDVQLASLLKPVQGERVVLSQPFFRYFLDRYDLDVADIVEPLPAKEPSPQQISRQIRRLQQNGAHVLFTQTQLPDRSARAVADAADLSTVNLDPIGGVEGRATYEELLFYNAQRILSSLQREPTPASQR